MTDRTRNIAVVAAAVLIIFGLAVWAWVKPPQQSSESERRLLEQWPEITLQEVLQTKWMSRFESYTLDQFPARDAMRTVKAAAVYGLFAQSDNNGLYFKDGHISKQDYPMNDYMLQNAADKMRSVYDQYLTGMDVYFSIVPDKNYHLSGEGGGLFMDYAAMEEFMKAQTGYMQYIDITGTLGIDDYYYTDSHWRQERLLPAAQTLAQAMGADVAAEYEEKVLDVPFYGVYRGQSALPLKADTIRYLTNKTLEGCTVTYYGSGAPKEGSIYNFEAAEGKDAYDFFLSGADPLVIIQNPAADTERELIIFRDSYGSSIAPLLVEGYSTVTLIDLRYIQSSIIGNFVDFEDQDVLWLLSSMLINSSTSLR